jgi:predicted nucleic acid-binding protein
VKAVVNAGPLIALGKLGQLGLLLRLYDLVLIPREVYNEVVVKGLQLGAPDARAVDFLVQQRHIQIVDVSLPSPLPSWAHPIDVGEIEVIVLAQQESVDHVLIDNLHARKAARQAGLRVRGTIGLLLEAVRKGHLTLPEFELLIQTIKAQPDLWISEQLCDRALAQARREAQQRP